MATQFVPYVVTHGGLIGTAASLDDVGVVPGTATGNTCPGGSGVALWVKAGTAAVTASLKYKDGTGPDGLTVTARAVAVPANKATLIPIQDAYADASTKLVTIDFSGAGSAGVTAAAISLGS